MAILGLGSSFNLLFILVSTQRYFCTAIQHMNVDEATINKGMEVQYHDPEDDEGMIDSNLRDKFTDPYKAPGCPERTFDMPWVHYGQPARCYLAGTRGPCPPMMKLFLTNSKNHTAICDCDDAGQYSKKDARFIFKKKEFCIKEGRALAYFLPKNRCYPLFDRGTCPRGYWLVLKKGRRVVCEKRRCPENLLDTSEYRAPFWFFDSDLKICFEAYTRGYCRDNQRLFPTKQSPLPKCVPVNVPCGGIYPFSSDIPFARCGPGSYSKLVSTSWTKKPG